VVEPRSSQGELLQILVLLTNFRLPRGLWQPDRRPAQRLD